MYKLGELSGRGLIWVQCWGLALVSTRSAILLCNTYLLFVSFFLLTKLLYVIITIFYFISLIYSYLNVSTYKLYFWFSPFHWGGWGEVSKWCLASGEEVVLSCQLGLMHNSTIKSISIIFHICYPFCISFFFYIPSTTLLEIIIR